MPHGNEAGVRMASALHFLDLLRSQPLTSAVIEDIKAHIAKNPDCVRRKDKATGRLPIHNVVDKVEESTLDKVKLLINAYPESLVEKDKCGQVPLHIAAAGSGQSEGVLRFVLTSCKMAMEIEDAEGRVPLQQAIVDGCFLQARILVDEAAISSGGLLTNLPLLHAAFEANAPDDFVSHLIEVAPECVRVIDSDCNLPIHYAAPTHPERVLLLINAYPESLGVTNNLGRLPIHEEARKGYGGEALRVMVEADPEGCFVADQNGCLPVHLAMFNYDLDIDTLQVFDRACPRAFTTVNSEGASALHLLFDAEVKHSKENIEVVVAWLVAHYPMMIRVIDNLGTIPLHWAVTKGFSTPQTLSLLSESFPRAFLVADNDGEFPLHYAVQRYRGDDKEDAEEAFIDNLTFMLDKCPGAVCKANLKGQLPIHIACAYDMESVVDLLVKFYPGSLAVYDHDGYLPFHVACKIGRSVAFLDHLLRMFKGSVLPPTEHHLPPLLLACENDDVPLDVVWTLVRKSTELIASYRRAAPAQGTDSSGTDRLA